MTIVHTTAKRRGQAAAEGPASTNLSRPFNKGSSRPAFVRFPTSRLMPILTRASRVYDSYNNTDNSGPWVQVGGTSLAAPSWAALIAIANQGRVLAGGAPLSGPLDGPGQTLAALYAISSTDFNDITSGSNGVFSAGPGYDEVTGLGSPKANLLVADLATYGTASQVAVVSQPPSSVITGDSFGVVVAAESPDGEVDPAFSGTVTISLKSNPGDATLDGTLSATAYHGVAVFDGLSLDQPGDGYTLEVTSRPFPRDCDKRVRRDCQPHALAGNVLPGADRCQPALCHRSGR